jgi:methylmalonyl-CoA mutase
LPIVGVNTFLDPEASEDLMPEDIELARATPEEKREQIDNLRAFQKRNEAEAPEALARLKNAALTGGNIFSELMEAVRVASLGQITHALYEVGGQYRRAM